MKLRVLFAGLAIAVVCMAAESGEALYQKAVTQERAGKLDEAIKLYEGVAHDFASDHPLAAKALMSAARCIETLGRDNASKLYEQVTREYGDQRQLAQAARSKLAALRQPAPQTMTLRKIETGDLDIIATDGQRAIYQDDSGTVFYGDLGGRNKQVVFKPKPEDLPGLRVVASRDMSMVLLSFSKQNGQQVYAVVNADGTGYREIARRSGPGTPASWSWDNRFVLLSEFASDAVGKPVSRLLSLSLADGRTSEVLGGPGVRNAGRTAVASPDGRFIAFEFGQPGAAGLYVVPLRGGEPHKVVDGGVLLDWTQDGRFLAFASRRSGTMAVYLLPMQDGHPTGEPQFVRNGSVTAAHTASNGALIYEATPPTGAWQNALGTLDGTGRVEGWRQLNLRGANASTLVPNLTAWSRDSSQIAYSAASDNLGKPGTVLLLRNIATGEDRELYRTDAELTTCLWASQHLNLFCEQVGQNGGLSELLSVALDSGRSQVLGSKLGGNGVFGATPDDRSLYLASVVQRAIVRWDIATNQETVIERVPASAQVSFASPDGWMPCVMNGQLEVHPLAGGDPKPLIYLGAPTSLGITPDSKWVLYNGRDSSGRHSLFRISTNGGQPERIGDFPSRKPSGWPLMISPNGKQVIAVSRAPSEFWALENFTPKAHLAHQ